MQQMAEEGRRGTSSTMSHYDESQSERLARKARDAPFMVAGLAGLVGLVGYSIYGFKNKKIKTSVYLIHTRVAAQGFVVACLTAGVSWNLFKNHIYPRLYPEAVEEKKN
ncbi:HIG1 domain family member 1C-like isoform X1 [Penaeus monodon]|nr:HIG1 domain family member 1C-like isoform X1 [Penaeus monodon]